LTAREENLEPLAVKMEKAFQSHFDKLKNKIFRNIDNAYKSYRIMGKDIDEDIRFIYFPPEAAELDEFIDLFTPIVWQVYEAGWKMAAKTINSPFAWDGDVNPTLLAVFEEQKNLIAGMSEDVYKELKERISMGFKEGWTLQETKDEVQKVFGSNDSRARRIAKTETGRGLNAASFAMYGQAEEVAGYEWSAVMDAATRSSHFVMDGERIIKGEVFSNGLQFPLDPLGPAQEVVNCRCISIPLTAKDMGLDT
jgi:SPP1 gp7 family putative phage head morphogenesis protein